MTFARFVPGAAKWGGLTETLDDVAPWSRGSRSLHRLSVLVRLAYRPELDGVRGIAILGVLVFHSYPLTDGWLGVEVFFVLSGFLITTLLLGEWNARGTISLRAFYARRVRRLLPALVVALLGFLVLSAVVDAIRPGFTSLADDVRSAVFGLFFVTNLTWAWWQAPAGGVSHLWTLSTEEQFYLVWPLSLLLLLRLGFRRRWLAVVPALGAATITAHALDLASRNTPRLNIRPDTGTAPLLVGCVCACILGEPRLKRALHARGTGVLEGALAGGLVLCMLDGLRLVPGPLDGALDPLVLVLFAIAVGFVLLRMMVVESSGTAGFLRMRGLVALGRWSYSLYLWHLILIDATPWLRPQVAEAIAVALAAASYRYIERPFLRRRPATGPTVAPVASAVSYRPAPIQPRATA